MDWQSETTKKHIKEAATQGCEFLGSGKDKAYRLYALPCGHEQQIQPGHLRLGKFECKTCAIEKLHQEAKAQGCKLLGAAEKAKHQNRLYELPCGHEQEVGKKEMRTGTFGCKICRFEKLNQEARAQGCKLLGQGKTNYSRLYELPCGHKQEVGTGVMRKGVFRCSVCMKEKLSQEARAQGCELLGAGRNSKFRLYALPCSHKQEVTTGSMRAGSVECKTCVADKLNQEAEAQGCKLLGKGKNANYRVYTLPCGHEQEASIGNMRIGNFLCQTCEETSRTLPSNVYLLHIKLDSDEWLKLGYAKSVDNRAKRYGVPESAVISTVYSVPLATGNEAHAAEAEIHSRYRTKLLPKKQMKTFHAKSGFEECYPVTMLDTLLDELKALEQSLAS